MTFATNERRALCDEALRAGPDAPTLSGDWAVADLVAHLYVREADPVGAAGIMVKPLAEVTAKRMAHALDRHGFEGLVDRVRNGPGRWSLFALGAVDEQANSVEMYVHHEDIRRANETPAGPRDLGAEVEDAMWKRLGLMGRLLFRRCSTGVVLERSDSGDTHRATSGNPTVTLVGKPSEIVLYAYGRTSVADVQVLGDADAVTAFCRADLSI